MNIAQNSNVKVIENHQQERCVRVAVIVMHPIHIYSIIAVNVLRRLHFISVKNSFRHCHVRAFAGHNV